MCSSGETKTKQDVPPASDTQPEQRRDRTRRRRRYAAACWLAAALPLCYGVLLLDIPAWIEPSRSEAAGQVVDGMSFSEGVRVRTAEVLGVVSVFALGASVGGFLNVVVYRWPRGERLLRSSRCPHCNAWIAPRDNIPVLGWIILGGRCRGCRRPISARYPTVEALTGALFLLLLFVEIYSGGANLPSVGRLSRAGLLNVVDAPWELVRVYAYHLALMCLLLVLALNEWDGRRPPMKLVATGLLIGFAFPALWPDVQPVAWWFLRAEWPAPWTFISHGGTSLCGVVAGGLFGMIIRRTAYPSDKTSAAAGNGWAVVVALSWIGLFLGWQAVLSVGAITAILQLLTVGLRCLWQPAARSPLSGLIAAAAMIHLCLWRDLCECPHWPGPRSPLWPLIAVGLATIGACYISRRRLRPAIASDDS